MSLILLGILNSQVDAGAAGAFDLLETQILTSSASSVTFTGLGSYSDYKHLQFRATLKSGRAVNGFDNYYITINGDTGANYSQHSLWADGTNVYSQNAASQTRILVREALVRNGTSETNVFSAQTVDILDFNSTSKNTTVRTFSGAPAVAEKSVGLHSGGYYNTAAVTSITFDSDTFNFVAGCRLSLYGVK